MSTEGPTIHDGSQTIAVAAYGNGNSLAGNGGSAQFLGVTLSQSVDRTSVLAAAAGAQIYGVLQNKPALGDAADVVIFGITKAVCAAAGVTRGKPQMVTATGAFTDWTAGSAYSQVGYALESATSGQVFAMFFWGAGGVKVLT